MEENGEAIIKEEPLSYEDKTENLIPIAKPLATERLLKKICKVTKKAHKRKAVTLGLKAVEKALRKGEKGLVFLAGDVTPLEIICHLPVMCEDRHISYCYVPCRTDLAEPLGRFGSVVVAMVKSNSDYEEAFQELEKQMNYLPSPV